VVLGVLSGRMTEPQQGYPYLTKGLLFRRARIAGEIEKLRARLAELELTLDRIDFTVRHFNPDATPEQLKPVRPYRRLKLFRQGQLRTRVLACLREAKQPLNCRAIALEVIRMGGFDGHEAFEIEKRVRSNVWNLLQEGRVVRIRAGKEAFFRLPTAEMPAVRLKGRGR